MSTRESLLLFTPCISIISWDIFLLAGDPAYDARVPADQPVFGSPDGIWVDPQGILWIQTDISNSSQNLAAMAASGGGGGGGGGSRLPKGLNTFVKRLQDEGEVDKK